ncbi:DUF805 domain-containing protein [Candidatus Pelagibacter sp.]|nr:DUF805 domain-containing protein [Candidatus Pelagibacter sp.]
MTFTESVSVCFKKYFVFEGRASRSEYWWFQLIVAPAYIIFEITDSESSPVSFLFLVITLLTLIPAISAGVRRLHDTNKSGFYLLLSFIPFIGGLIVLFFLIAQGTKGKNRFGADPIVRKKIAKTKKKIIKKK